RIAGSMGLPYFAVRQKLAEQGGGLDLAGMGPGQVKSLVEGVRRAPEGFKARGCCSVRRPPEIAGVVHQKRQHRGLCLSAVDESDALLGLELDRLDPRCPEGSPGINPSTSRRIADFSLTDQRQCQVRQRGEIAARTHTPLLGYDGMNAVVQQIGQ